MICHDKPSVTGVLYTVQYNVCIILKIEADQPADGALEDNYSAQVGVTTTVYDPNQFSKSLFVFKINGLLVTKID